MLALSVWQPWASLLTWGYKEVETRGWKPYANVPPFRLLIHAAKRTSREQKDLCQLEPFKTYLREMGYDSLEAMPKGVLLASCTIVRVEKTEILKDFYDNTEISLGDWSPGRFGWIVRDKKIAAELIPFRGDQGLFYVPDIVAERL